MPRAIGRLNLTSISTRLYLAFAVVAGLTLIAGVTAWWTFSVTEQALKQLTTTKACR